MNIGVCNLNNISLANIKQDIASCTSAVQEKVKQCSDKVMEWGQQVSNSCQPTIDKLKTSVQEIKIGERAASIRDYITSTSEACNQKVMGALDKIDNILDEKLPNWSLQTKLDALGRAIEEKFAPLTEFNNWLNANVEGNWFKQMAMFLCKLPLRVARNIVQTLYHLIKAILYAAVHPLKSLNNLAKMSIQLVNELMKTENWAKLGVGIMGAGVAQALISMNPIAPIGMAIGGALALSGLSIEALKAAIDAEKGTKLKAVGEKLFSQIKDLPESGLTGAGMGLLVGVVQRIIQRAESLVPVTNEQEGMQWANRYIAHHGLPEPVSKVFRSGWIEGTGENGRIYLTWEGQNTVNQVLALRKHWGTFDTSWLRARLDPWAPHHYEIFENAALSKMGPLATGTTVLAKAN